MKKRGLAFAEYAIVLGTLSAVIMGMNIYIKRGIQGRMKEMTDFFIGKDQIVEINPSVRTDMKTDMLSDVNEERRLGIAGSAEVRLHGTTETTVNSHMEDFNISLPPGAFISAEAGAISSPENSHQQQGAQQ